MKHYSIIFLTIVGCILLSTTAYGDEDETMRFEANLSGDQEAVFDADGIFVPGGTPTDAEGRIRARFDRSFTRVRVDLRIEDLVGEFAAAHFHCGRPGQNGPIPFGLVAPGPLTFDGRRVRGTLINTDFNGADCVPFIGRVVNNIAALAFAMRDGLIYINVHSTPLFGSGEIRGQMQAR